MSRVSASCSFKIDRDQIAIAATFVLIVGILAQPIGLSAHVRRAWNGKSNSPLSHLQYSDSRQHHLSRFVSPTPPSSRLNGMPYRDGQWMITPLPLLHF